MVASHLFLLVAGFRCLLEALFERGLESLGEDRAEVLLEALPRSGRRPASASRIDQYSQVRPTTLGMALIEPARFVSPPVSGTTLPSRCACS
jgi:hypothetical protein